MGHELTWLKEGEGGGGNWGKVRNTVLINGNMTGRSSEVCMPIH